jgi:hypothetical protein
MTVRPSTCHGCEHYFAKIGTETGTELDHGTCHIRAPAAISHGAYVLGVWPKVKESDWCAEGVSCLDVSSE